MRDLYSKHDKHYVAVDCIIFGFDKSQLKLLCVKRHFEPGKGKWSLMGGFVNRDESVDNAAERVLHELTGLRGIYLEQLQAYGELDRDPESRVISIAYFALISTERFASQMSNGFDAKWFTLKSLPELIFDHELMVDKGLKRLMRRCKSQPVGFELLPDKFTMPQLMILYEAIYQQKFDKRNFRKKILSNGILSKLEEKDMKGSRKGAYLYRFDKDKYDELVRSGSNFDF